MLTVPVNIAVFATFWPRVEDALLAITEFQRVCRDYRCCICGKSGNDRGKNGKGGNEIGNRFCHVVDARRQGNGQVRREGKRKSYAVVKMLVLSVR